MSKGFIGLQIRFFLSKLDEFNKPQQTKNKMTVPYSSKYLQQPKSGQLHTAAVLLPATCFPFQLTLAEQTTPQLCYIKQGLGLDIQ